MLGACIFLSVTEGSLLHYNSIRILIAYKSVLTKVERMFSI